MQKQFFVSSFMLTLYLIRFFFKILFLVEVLFNQILLITFPCFVCIINFLFLDRKKVLRHHPDKKKNNVLVLPPEINEHEYFTCITKAYEVLSSVEDRQAYDSVDEEFPDEIPSYSPKQDFFEVFSKCVKLNARL